MNKVIVIVGPTASGKTRLSLDIAERFGGEIVSADSMQIYKHMDIGTAKPTREEMRGIPHHMIDIVEPTDSFTLADYLDGSRACVADILNRNRLPIIVGGTGLYVTSFIDNRSLCETDTDIEYRNYLNGLAETFGGEYIHKMAEKVDPDAASKLHNNDVKRLVRILELYHSTGKTKTELDAESLKTESPYKFHIIGLNFSDRELLYHRINERVDAMLEAGLVEEVRSLRKNGLLPDDSTAAQAIGYKQLIPYIDGKTDLREAIDDVKRETRRYAKRQLTWFRRDARIKWSSVDCLCRKDDATTGEIDAIYETFCKIHGDAIELFIHL